MGGRSTVCLRGANDYYCYEDGGGGGGCYGDRRRTLPFTIPPTHLTTAADNKLRILRSITTLDGRVQIIIILILGTATYVLAWKRGIAILTAGNVKVTPDPRLHLTSGYTLQIKDAREQDAGDYICQIATIDPREITHHVEILGSFIQFHLPIQRP